MNGTRLSVIVPGYNNPKEWWLRCIDSICLNIDDNDEVICVDDASSSRPEFLEQYSIHDKRIHVIYRSKKGGPSAARNDGLLAAQGEYVTFIDSDDELLPNAYCRALKALADGADIACFGVDAIWVNERLHRVSLPNIEDSGALDVYAVKRFLENTLMFYVWNKVYNINFLRSNGLTFSQEMEMGEDLDFILRCVMARARWKMLNYVGIKYYRTHASILSRYKATYVEGVHQTTRVWKDYKSRVQDGRRVLGNFGETADVDVWRGEWDNIWRRDSPYSLLAKWEFLANHSEIVKWNRCLFFVYRMIYQFFRRNFYTRAIQRWHIKRTYPDVTSI